MNINKISNEKATNVKNHAMCAVFGHEADGFSVNMGFVTEVYDELFHFLEPTPSKSAEIIDTIMKHGIALSTEEHTMINSFINKSGDRLVYSVTGYEFVNSKKRGVAMVVVSRGGVAAVFCFGYGVFFNKTRETFYIDRIPHGNYMRYNLGVSEVHETHVVLVDTKRGSFEINQGYGKSVYDYYRVGEKIPAVLALHDGHVKAREEEKEREREYVRSVSSAMYEAASKFNGFKARIKKAASREDAAKLYRKMYDAFIKLEECRDEYARVEPVYAARRKPAQMPNFNELYKTESQAEIKDRPTLRLVA
ncbi:hypothetical protein RU309_000776 [Salmonella enterica]|uniref:hypothetical protein n=1 Tax=Salmonella enterica TaxID=28901 RepID=UPI000D580DBB|nr:hypothetical protein [Salmonella enterica]EAB2160652.1 hypothetical protein [Salmonella enterica]EAQ0861370.1 hypothetical protein [Salmonella enterica]EAR1690480.1 hypothetical protein [Salmonella enterica]EAU6770079.1 hypothetical protein [Salmonella enterica]ECQ2206938.1 hypothetical protein [Salmonella enterica]